MQDFNKDSFLEFLISNEKYQVKDKDGNILFKPSSYKQSSHQLTLFNGSNVICLEISHSNGYNFLPIIVLYENDKILGAVSTETINHNFIKPHNVLSIFFPLG